MVMTFIITLFRREGFLTRVTTEYLQAVFEVVFWTTYAASLTFNKISSICSRPWRYVKNFLKNPSRGTVKLLARSSPLAPLTRTLQKLKFVIFLCTLLLWRTNNGISPTFWSGLRMHNYDTCRENTRSLSGRIRSVPRVPTISSILIIHSYSQFEFRYTWTRQ